MERLIIYPPIILCFRTTAIKWLLSSEGDGQNWSPNEVQSKLFPQNLPRTPPTTTSSLGSGSYTVLPPIGKPLRGEEPELSPSQSVNTAYPIHRSSSDGYLVQMEKQKQLRGRVTYKVGVSVSFMCVLNGGILNILCIIVYLYPCYVIWDVVYKNFINTTPIPKKLGTLYKMSMRTEYNDFF